MLIQEIPDYIEQKNVAPQVYYNHYNRLFTNNFDDFMVFRQDFTLLLSKSFLQNISFIKTKEYDKKLNYDFINVLQIFSGAYNYYITDLNVYVFEESLVNYVLDNDVQILINFGIYFKKELKLPKELQYELKIPREIKPFQPTNLNNIYSYFKEEKIIEKDGHILYFKNLEYDEYKNHMHSFNQINYYINNDEYISARKDSNDLYRLMESFSNGYKYPCCITYIDNKIYPIACNYKLFCAYYLRMPKIPVCIIASQDKIDYTHKIIG